MATQEQIEELLTPLEHLHSGAFFKRIGEIGVGIGAVLRYLDQSESAVTAGEISRFLNVSTARVAVLLKKMEAKELIERQADTRDARKTVIRLSTYGEETVHRCRALLYRQVGEVIDRIGLDRMKEFIAVSEEIRTIMKPPAWEWQHDI